MRWTNWIRSSAGRPARRTRDGEDRPVYLQDLGLKIVRDYEDPPSLICRFTDAETSRPCVVVALTMKSGANVTICEAAKERIREMQTEQQSIPDDIAITAISDQSVNVNKKISDVVSNVVGAILIVIVVVYLIVGFRSAAVMASNIPVVVLGSLALITLFGVQLEQISLASIIIALGLLVDNAVQVCDQSRTNQMAGMDPEAATVKGSGQVASPMLMGTATTVAAFAPMLIGLTGTQKEYVYSLPVTLSVTLIISWFLAMTFCSILAAKFIRAPKDPDKPSAPLPWLFAKLQALIPRKKTTSERDTQKTDFVDRIFRSVVRLAIDFKVITVAVAIGLLVLSLMLPVGSEFFPKDLRDQFAVEVWLPENVAIEKTDEAARQVERILQKLSPTVDEDGEAVERIYGIRTMVGGGGSRWYLGWAPESRKPNYAEIVIRTTDAKYTPELARRLREISEKGDAVAGPRAGNRCSRRAAGVDDGTVGRSCRAAGFWTRICRHANVAAVCRSRQRDDPQLSGHLGCERFLGRPRLPVESRRGRRRGQPGRRYQRKHRTNLECLLQRTSSDHLS